MAVSATRLGLVQSLIRSLDQRNAAEPIAIRHPWHATPRLMVTMPFLPPPCVPRQAARYRHAWLSAASCCAPSRSASGRMTANSSAAVTCHQIGWALDACGQRLCNRPQAFVTRLMAIKIVVLLKEIDIAHAAGIFRFRGACRAPTHVRGIRRTGDDWQFPSSHQQQTDV